MNRRSWCLVAVWLTLTGSLVLAKDGLFSSKGVSIRYLDQGQGEAIVLIHGAGSTAQIWNTTGVLPDLAKNYRVIAMDLRGYGGSDKPHDPKQLAGEMPLDVIRLLDHLGISRAHIVGHSLGGVITAKLLTQHPERFLTATLLAAAPVYAPTPDQARIQDQEATERERECVSRTQVRSLVPIGDPPPSDGDIKARSESCFANPEVDRFAMAALDRSFYDLAVTRAQVSAIKIPTLGVVGSLDSTRNRMQAVKEFWPDLNLIVVDGATHAGDRGIMTRAEFTMELRRFIVAHHN
jgi:pimeloyl-ACP methyl ester carboxylesterase